MTKHRRHGRIVESGSFELQSAFDIRHLPFIFRLPNEPADQHLPGALRASRRPDDSCHPDAATKK